MWTYTWEADSHGKVLTITFDGKVVHQFNDDDGIWNRITEDGTHQPVAPWVSTMLDLNYQVDSGLTSLLDAASHGE